MIDVIKSIVRYYIVIIVTLVFIPIILFSFYTGVIFYVFLFVLYPFSIFLFGLLPLWILYRIVKYDVVTEDGALLVGVKWWLISYILLYAIGILMIIGAMPKIAESIPGVHALLTKVLEDGGSSLLTYFLLWFVTLPIGVLAFYVKKIRHKAHLKQ